MRFPSARVVVAEVNDQLPVTFGDTSLEPCRLRPRYNRIAPADRDRITSGPRARTARSADTSAA